MLVQDRTKSNVLSNLSKNQLPDIDTIYLFVKDPLESKYQLLINAREKVEIKNLKNPKAFTNHLQTIYDVYENLEDYNPTKKRKMLIVFDDAIANMEANKKLSLIVIELFLRGRKISILLVFISQFYFKVPKTIRLNETHYLIMKNASKRELKQITSNHSSELTLRIL